MPQTTLTPEEKVFCEMLHDKVEFFEFFWSTPEELWESRDYQTEILLDDKDRLCCCASRSVGKTTTIETDIIQTVLDNPNKSGLLASPNDVHLAPTVNRIVGKLYSDPYLKLQIKSVVRSPNIVIEFINGFILYARIEGSNRGRNFLNLHVDFIWIDEAQLIGKEASRQLLPALNENGIIKLFGVPNGVRGTYFWNISENDQPNESGKQRYAHHHISRLDSPGFTEEMKREAIALYGGEQSQNYINLVLGLWGESQYGAFDPDEYNSRVKFDINYTAQTVIPADLKEELHEFLFLPSEVEGDVYCGCDIGYDPDPTIILLFDITDKQTKLFHKIILKKIKTPDQEKIFHYIFQFYPTFKKAGIDAGNIGAGIIHGLHDTTRFPNTNYQNTVIPVRFNASLEIGKDEDGKPIKQQITFYTHTLLQQLFANKHTIIPDDTEFLNELLIHTMSKNARQNYLFKGDPDHHIAAARCACFVMAELTKKDIQGQYCFSLADF